MMSKAANTINVREVVIATTIAEDSTDSTVAYSATIQCIEGPGSRSENKMYKERLAEGQ